MLTMEDAVYREKVELELDVICLLVIKKHQIEKSKRKMSNLSLVQDRLI